MQGETIANFSRAPFRANGGRENLMHQILVKNLYEPEINIGQSVLQPYETKSRASSAERARMKKVTRIYKKFG